MDNQFKNILTLTNYLNQLSPNVKIKIKIKDFQSYREFLPLCRNYDTKFVTFKYETSFEGVSDNGDNSVKTETIDFKESLKTWLKTQKVDKDISDILLKEE